MFHGEPLVHEVEEPEEGAEAFWRAQEPIMAAQRSAAASLAPALIGLTVAQAQAFVEKASHDSGVRLRMEAIPVESRVTPVYHYGRIGAFVRDGIVVRADPG